MAQVVMNFVSTLLKNSFTGILNQNYNMYIYIIIMKFRINGHAFRRTIFIFVQFIKTKNKWQNSIKEGINVIRN